MADETNDPYIAPEGQGPAISPAELARRIRDFNASNPAHEDLWTRGAPGR